MIERLKKPRVDVVRISLYGQHGFEDEHWVSRVLEAFAAVPAVVPVRFSSDYGVHWQRCDSDKPRPAAFDEACLTSQVEWQGAHVGFGGNIAALASSQTAIANPTTFNHVTVSVDPNHESMQPDGTLHRLLASTIETVGAVYAYGSWQHGVIYDKRRNLMWDKKSDHADPLPLMNPAWQGLPRDHVWLEWFGAAYAPLVEQPLAGLTVPFVGGLLAEYGWSDHARSRQLPPNLLAGGQPGGRAELVPAGW